MLCLQGIHNVALATTTRNSEPRVAPINTILYRGEFHVPTVTTSARARHVSRRPQVSFTYYEGNDLALIAHGNASSIPDSEPTFDELNELYVNNGGHDVRSWGAGAYLRVAPDVLYTFARYPEEF